MSNDPQTPHRGSPTDHLANERTFLDWIRTGVGIMAFGFVVVKFSLFVRQLSLALVTVCQVNHKFPLAITHNLK